MLRGKLVGLRARRESDVSVLHTELYEDVAMRARADGRAWRPVPDTPAMSPFAVSGPSEQAAVFSVVRLADDELAGDAVLWQINTFHRNAHIGLSLRPAFRSEGLGGDVVAVLCGYGFDILGLHRLQIETLCDNHAMIRTAERAGFVREGNRRRAAWIDGEFTDELIFGMLADEWRAQTPRP
jgi:RimJ/RimL family protein N-acetyltransferase